MKSVYDGLIRLESINNQFDYEKKVEYVMLLKAFIRKAKEYASTHSPTESTPIFDITNRRKNLLPNDISLRLDLFLNSKPDYSTTTRNVCRWFLHELYTAELAMIASSQESHYEELIQMLELGGDFYDHHGAICIRDAAMLPYATA